MYKKSIIAIILALLLALPACSVTDDAEETETEPSEQGTAEQEEEQAEPEEEPSEEGPTGEGAVEEAPEEETPANAADLGDSYVEIKSARLTTDYEGNQVIIITYDWTNTSDDTTSAMVSVSSSVFQDGISLETAYMIEDESYDDRSAYMAEVRPDTTIEIQEAFVLRSESIVEVEIGEWFTLDDNPPIAYMEFDPTAL